MTAYAVRVMMDKRNELVDSEAQRQAEGKVASGAFHFLQCVRVRVCVCFL